MEEIVKTLKQIHDLKKLLIPNIVEGFPPIKTIYNQPEFINWKEKVTFQLQGLKPEPVIVDTIKLLQDGFKTGWNDEKNFKKLQAKVDVIIENIGTFLSEEEMAVQSDRLAKGTIVHTAFSDYELIEQIGSGGNGRVFSAKNVDREVVAIKFVEKNIPSNKLKRFKNEIHFCEQHEHKNIIKIIDRGYAFLDEKDYVFYVMPLMSQTLRDKIREGIPHNEIPNIFVGILEGLKYAHNHGSIHRDIKPENILFAEGSLEPVICDFGIAHFSEEDLLTSVETKVGDRMANFSYAAPEQRNRGAQIKPQTDIHAVALILNEMFTGQIPLAAGYKTIGSVNEEYKYLDELFECLYNQDPNSRLYPEEIIISELKRLTETHHKQQEKANLQAVVNEMIEPDEFKAKIVDIEYRNDNLVFIFDKDLPEGWIHTMMYGRYSHSCVVGYGPDRLEKVGQKGLCINLRGKDGEDLIRDIARNVKEWVDTTNDIFSNELKRIAVEQHRRAEEQRIAKINKIEKETEMKAKISAILSELNE